MRCHPIVTTPYKTATLYELASQRPPGARNSKDYMLWTEGYTIGKLSSRSSAMSPFITHNTN